MNTTCWWPWYAGQGRPCINCSTASSTRSAPPSRTRSSSTRSTRPVPLQRSQYGAEQTLTNYPLRLDQETHVQAASGQGVIWRVNRGVFPGTLFKPIRYDRVRFLSQALLSNAYNTFLK